MTRVTFRVSTLTAEARLLKTLRGAGWVNVRVQGAGEIVADMDSREIDFGPINDLFGTPKILSIEVMRGKD